MLNEISLYSHPKIFYVYRKDFRMSRYVRIFFFFAMNDSVNTFSWCDGCKESGEHNVGVRHQNMTPNLLYVVLLFFFSLFFIHQASKLSAVSAALETKAFSSNCFHNFTKGDCISRRIPTTIGQINVKKHY